MRVAIANIRAIFRDVSGLCARVLVIQGGRGRSMIKESDPRHGSASSARGTGRGSTGGHLESCAATPSAWPDPRGAVGVASRTSGRGGTRSTATLTRCRPAARARRACRRDVTVLGRGDHVPDRLDLRGRQAMRRRPRAGQLIVERTRGLPSAPGVKPTRRQTQEPEDRSQRDRLARDPRPSGFAACRVRSADALLRA